MLTKALKVCSNTSPTVRIVVTTIKRGAIQFFARRDGGSRLVRRGGGGVDGVGEAWARARCGQPRAAVATLEYYTN